MNRQYGEILDRKFRLKRVLGEGGCGTVFAATDLVLDRTIALKLLLPEHSTDRQMVERFLREARIAAKIRNRHVVQVYEAGQLSDGQLFIAMELLEGEELSELLARRGALPPDEVLDYALQACEGLAAAHVLGVVHRDVKPSNLFVTVDADEIPVLKILDFGISSIQAGAGVPLLTTADVVMGTTEYSAPEQLRCARRASVRADIWSLGVVLYEALAGRHPFREESEVEVSEGALAAQAQLDLPNGLRDVLLRCLQRDPAARFSDVGELAGALAYRGRPAHLEQAMRVQRLLSGGGGGGRRDHAAPPNAVAASVQRAAVTPLEGASPRVRGAGLAHDAGHDGAGASWPREMVGPQVRARTPAQGTSNHGALHGIGALETKLASRGWKMALAVVGAVAVPAVSAIVTVRYLDSMSASARPLPTVTVQDVATAWPAVDAASASGAASTTAPFTVAYVPSNAATVASRRNHPTSAAVSCSPVQALPESGPHGPGPAGTGHRTTAR